MLAVFTRGNIMANRVSFTVVGDERLNEAIRMHEEGVDGAEEALNQRVREIVKERGFALEAESETKEEKKHEFSFLHFFVITAIATAILVNLYNIASGYINGKD
ncbi:MAG: hypothetical protein K1060chlam5_00808 [Candidatus Anoxychlamydiales bacterium]|nr:hypothetical protein [Candidatus Anoxychlamydiales bacterium]